MVSKQELQDSVLKRRNLRRGKFGKLVSDGSQFDRGNSTIADDEKTTLMKVLEREFGTPIEELISLRYSLPVVAARLGVSMACVSRWRLQLGLRKRIHPPKGMSREQAVAEGVI